MSNSPKKGIEIQLACRHASNLLSGAIYPAALDLEGASLSCSWTKAFLTKFTDFLLTLGSFK